ncbi:MAG: hypothetical protein M3N43_14815 [Actinomycetota bacterium]|nr:hypothetical protein [Actinomycetota bacterium]
MTLQLGLEAGIVRTDGHMYVYKDQGPFPGVTRICGLQDSAGGADGLMNWAVGLALDTVEALTKADANWEEVRSAAFQAKNNARDLGSAIHASVDRFNRHQALGVTDKTASYVAQYGAFLYNRGVEILGSEKYVINTSVGFGGTYDSLVTIDGETGPLDVKSGKEKASQRLQLTGLSMGELHGEPLEEPVPLPPLDDVGFILLLRPDGYELVRHEITQADRDHFTRLVEIYHHVRSWAEGAAA